MTRAAETTALSADDALPTFRRARPDDALNFAQTAFLAGHRVDMGTLASQLAIGRTTLYRWFGTRDQLLERVLVRLTHEFSAAAQAGLNSKGEDRVLEFIRRMIGTTVEFEPVRTFVSRETQLALRILIGEHGAVHRAIVQEILAVIAQERSPEAATALEDRVNVAVQIGTALQWATYAIGDEPQTERVLDIVRMVITATP